MVSRQLGHADPAIAMRVYARLIEGQGRAAATVPAGALREARSGLRQP